MANGVWLGKLHKAVCLRDGGWCSDVPEMHVTCTETEP